MRRYGRPLLISAELSANRKAMHTFPDHLLKGHANFMAGRYAREKDRIRDLASEGQNPSTMIIACCDSRAAPEMIFDAGPGELFVLRNVANLVPPFEPDENYHGVSAALEFAVTQLNVEDIVVMGHGYCGGCAAALTGQFDKAGHGEGHFIAHWISMLTPARDRIRAEHPVMDREAFRAMEHEGVRISLRNLRTFPWVAEREKAGALELHGAFFAIDHGILHVLDEASGAFAAA